MQDAVRRASHKLGTMAVLPQLEALAKLYYHMFDAYEHIRLNHFHSDEVVKGLRLISSALCSCAEAPYLMLHMHGTRTLGMLLRCLSNIDEEVLASACDALFCLLNRSPPARLLFLRRRAIAELNDCLRDYNTAIKTTSLQVRARVRIRVGVWVRVRVRVRG